MANLIYSEIKEIVAVLDSYPNSSSIFLLVHLTAERFREKLKRERDNPDLTGREPTPFRNKPKRE